MLYSADFTQLDEAAAGFPIDAVPLELCRQLHRSITTPPHARRVTIQTGGKTYAATWAGEHVRIASLLSTEIVAETMGPGAELKAIFQAFGIRETPGCQCGKLSRWMNEIGPAGCLAQLDKIVDAIEAKARHRKELPWLPCKRLWIRAAVRLAIWRARR